MSETPDDEYIRPRDMKDSAFVAWVREDINNLSPKTLSYSQRCELFETILALCDRLEKSVSGLEQKTKEIQEINRVLIDTSAQWRSRELWKSSCEAKDAEIERLRKIAEAAREYRKLTNMILVIEAEERYDLGLYIARHAAMRALDTLLAEEEKR